MILGNKNFKKEEPRPSQERASKILASPEPLAIVYPQVCNFCEKNRLKHNGKRVSPTTITTAIAESPIKNAAKCKDEDMYRRIKNEDLIAKEKKSSNITFTVIKILLVVMLNQPFLTIQLMKRGTSHL